MSVVRSPRLLAAALGFGGVAAVTSTFFLFNDAVHVAIPLLLLLIPVAGASVLADWRIAVPVAVVASTAYALAFLPPVGGVRVGFTHDVWVLATFTLVAVVIGAMKGRDRGAPTEIDEGRSVLLRGVSHNLRSPLNTIRTVSTALLNDGEYDDATRRQLLGLVADESERLDRIVENLLSVSRVQAGSLMPDLRAESVEQMVAAAAERFAASSSHHLVIEVEPDLPDVRADAVQIDQVLTNLIENAVRHTPAGTQVRVNAIDDGAAVRIEVADDGPGLPADVIENGFAPMPRMRAGSTGLGLAVAKAIVEAHGGTITAGDGPSGGACVRFTLAVDGRNDHRVARRG